MLISSVWRERSTQYFSVGLMVGGASTGLLLSVTGSLLLAWWVPRELALGILGLAGLAVAANEFGLVKLKLPQNARQVPERIARAGPRFGAFQFGVEMGTGMRTFMTSATPHLLLIAVIFGADPVAGLLAGTGFGIGRTMVPLSRALSGLDMGWSDAFERSYGRLRLICFATVVGALHFALVSGIQ